MTTTDSATELTHAEKAALLGAAGGIAAGIAHFTGSAAATYVAIALLGVAAAVGFSSGWVWGLTPRAAAAPASLVGMRIGFGGHRFTVLDDSAVRGDGRRASVVAADEAGQLGSGTVRGVRLRWWGSAVLVTWDFGALPNGAQSNAVLWRPLMRIDIPAAGH
ncbi:hypothetical protein C5U48_02695 [Mycolicibacter virginiensis]|uniref:Uncharacterized protein n=1 Tax=Mycolicibacter virginiensis TaxID=1795032 RepID=A0A9X7IQW6_9MYCO|nr:hypothetical protein [Mycolicibacter virginiensis]PQM53736.1 hypothetical protein C5U48_02695 [Mycolicibacter virginiensis]